MLKKASLVLDMFYSSIYYKDWVEIRKSQHRYNFNFAEIHPNHYENFMYGKPKRMNNISHLLLGKLEMNAKKDYFCVLHNILQKRAN